MNETIAGYLDRRELVHSVEDGVHMVPFGERGGEDARPAAVLLLWAGETAGDGLMVQMHAARVGSTAAVGDLLGRCNEWNRLSRATKARVDPEPDPHVVLEAWLPSLASMSEAGVGAFLDVVLADMLASAPGGESWPSAAPAGVDAGA